MNSRRIKVNVKLNNFYVRQFKRQLKVNKVQELTLEKFTKKQLESDADHKLKVQRPQQRLHNKVRFFSAINSCPIADCKVQVSFTRPHGSRSSMMFVFAFYSSRAG